MSERKLVKILWTAGAWAFAVDFVSVGILFVIVLPQYGMHDSLCIAAIFLAFSVAAILIMGDAVIRLCRKGSAWN